MILRITTKPEIQSFVRAGVRFYREPKILEIGKDITQDQANLIIDEPMLIAIDVTKQETQAAFKSIDEQVESKKDVTKIHDEQKKKRGRKPKVEITDNK